MISTKFKENDVVCLTFDKNKRFIVVNAVSLSNEPIVTVAYFNECRGEISTAYIPEEYLCPIDSKD